MLVAGNLAVLLMMAIVTTGEPTEHALGQYVVSFDLDEDIEWTVLEPVLLELYDYNVTTYPLNGFAKDAPIRENHVTVSIAEIYPFDPEAMRYLSTIENLTIGIKTGLTLSGWEAISISPRIFDGNQGMLGVAYWDALEETIYYGYWVGNNTMCGVTSNLRWGKGTRQIFNTIHIEPQAFH